jgi:hypothetical protein
MPQKITIYVDQIDDSIEFDQVQEFLTRWKSAITIADYSTGGWEHTWNLIIHDDAIQEIPKHWLCSSEWAGYQ